MEPWGTPEETGQGGEVAMIHFSHVYIASTDMRAWVLHITSCVRI